MHTYICHFKCKWCMKKKNCRLTEKLCLSGGNSGTCKLQLPRTGLTKLNSISKPKSVQPKRPTRRMRNTNNRNLVSMPGSFFFALLCTAGAVYVCVCVCYLLYFGENLQIWIGNLWYVIAVAIVFVMFYRLLWWQQGTQANVFGYKDKKKTF